MKSFGVVLAVAAGDNPWTRRSGAGNGAVAQCGSNVPNFTEKCGDLISPPTCAEDEACYTEDGCAYSCVKKNQCQLKLYNALLEDGKLLCNCEGEPSFPYSWTCDFDGNQHGQATVPPIEKNYPWDDRKFTMIEGTRIDEYNVILADQTSYFNGFFQASPSSCQGEMITEAGITKVLFDDIFNNQDCMPKCQLKEEIDGSLSERCDVVIGYDDLMLSLNGTGSEPAAMARGASWELTCFRTLQDTVEDTGMVIDEPLAPVESDTRIETIFSLDIACCDPEDPNCTDDCTRTPVIQIGPYAVHKKFFMKMGFEYGNKVLKDRGYLHIESCTFEEIDENGNILNGPLELIHDGCPNKFGSMSIIENMRDRTLEYSYREQMDMLPMKIDRGAEVFNLTCDLLACPWYAVEYNLCKLKDSCDESDRYDPLITYANDNFNPGFNWVGRKRRSSGGQFEIPMAETITKTMRHPCTEVKKEGDVYCVQGDDDCWTYDICNERKSTARYAPTGEDPMSSANAAVFSALVLLTIL